MSVINAKKLLYRNYRQEITSNNDITGLEVGKFRGPNFYAEYEIESGNKKVKLTVISGAKSGDRIYTYKSSGNVGSEVIASVTDDNEVLVGISGMKSKTVNISSNVISGEIVSLAASEHIGVIVDTSEPFEEFYREYILKADNLTLSADDSIDVEATDVNITGETTIAGKTTITGETTIAGKTIIDDSTVVIDNNNVNIDGDLDVTGNVKTATFESTGNSSIGENLTVASNIETNTFKSKSNSEVEGNLAVTGETSTGTLTSSGNANVGGDLKVRTDKLEVTNNKTSVNNTDITLNGTDEVNIKGSKLKVDSPTEINSTLDTTGNITGGSGLSIAGETTLDGRTTINDNLTVSKGGLTVTGKATLTDGTNSIKMGDSLNKISLTATDIDLNGETGITGNTNITGTLNTTGNIKTDNDFEGNQIEATSRLITK